MDLSKYDSRDEAAFGTAAENRKFDIETWVEELFGKVSNDEYDIVMEAALAEYDSCKQNAAKRAEALKAKNNIRPVPTNNATIEMLERMGRDMEKTFGARP